VCQYCRRNTGCGANIDTRAGSCRKSLRCLHFS